MENFEQRTIEYFFKKYDIVDQAEKAKDLAEITDLVYEYNMAVRRFNQADSDELKTKAKEDIEYSQKQIAKILEKKNE